MNKRDVILDFTSLLDVVMLILFFFVLFSRFETTEMQQQLQAERQELQAEYSALSAEAQQKYDAACDYLEEVKRSDERAAENLEGIHAFASGKALRVYLNMNVDAWQLDIYCGEKLLSEIPEDTAQKMEAAFLQILSANGYKASDTILCELMYDATEGGTAAAYRETHALFQAVQEAYPHFFAAETDISMFGGN